MTKVNMFEEMQKKSFLDWFIMESINTDIMLDDNYDPEDVDVKFIINGIECPLKETIEFLGKQFDELVYKKAKEITQDKFDELFFDRFNELSYKVRELQDDMDSKLSDIFR